MNKHVFNARRRRQKRVRAKILGKSNLPRLSVFRANKHIYAQVIDDQKGVTIAATNDVKLSSQDKLTKTQKAHLVGNELGKALLKLAIRRVVFDRGPYAYGGRVKTLAEGVRETGVVI